MTQAQRSSGIPTPPLSYLAQKSTRKSRANAKSLLSGAVMKNHSRSSNASPYSAMLCILLLLATGVAVKTGAAVHQGPDYLAQNR
jgi:hypothetical protein